MLKGKRAMTKAFVFGKFLPFHKGHEAMIRFALTKCDFLTVLVCCSDKETIPGAARSSWIKDAFAAETKIEIQVFDYLESDLPNTSQTSEEVSAIWANAFARLFPGYTLLITSEDYGKLVAAYLNIRHIAFDISRTLYPVSATAIRDDLFENWNFLPTSVKPDLAVKIVILGTESTGKTTLAKALTTHFHCSLVLEAGRDIIADSNDFSFGDLYRVAKEHARRIDEAVLGDSPLVIIDTDIHITQSYARFIFQKELTIAKEIYESNKANLYLYLTNDVEYVQDGSRLNEGDRNLLDLSHRRALKDHNIDMVEIKGTWEERRQKAIGLVADLLAMSKQNGSGIKRR
jgi:HTH-type transcriptional regulator, transcriptional repressor of NAD biosynthesis genes